MLDQILHIIVSSILVILFSFLMPIWMAVVTSIITGVIREVYQRFDLNREAFDFGLGSRLDLVFWITSAYVTGVYLG